jgi:hypothetical protein
MLNNFPHGFFAKHRRTVGTAAHAALGAVIRAAKIIDIETIEAS